MKRMILTTMMVCSLTLLAGPLIAKVLPGKKSALFFQIDKRLALLIDLQLASEIPLVEQ